MALGAQGVYVGARFLLTAESPAAASTKATIARSTPDQVALVSDNQRAVLTPAGQRYAHAYTQGSPTADLDHAIGQAGGLRTGMLLGDPEHGIVAVNSGSATLNTVVSVQALVTELASGFSD